MKSLIIFATIVAGAFGNPGGFSYSTQALAYPNAGYSSLTYPASTTGYAAAPPAAYASPQTAVSYNTPSALTYASPGVQYNTPTAVTYGSPAVQYNTPAAVTYASPAVQYNTPTAVTYGSPAAAVTHPGYTKTQYHSQDELGQASHGYAYPGQAAAETRDAAGNVRGSYAYINPDGNEVRVNYVADSLGFRAESNALPVGPAAPVQDTPEVAAARAAHFAAVQQVQARGRKRRGVSYSYPAVAVAPALTYAPVAGTYAAAPLTYATTSYAALPALRAATLTHVVNNPGHAVSYRVD